MTEEEATSACLRLLAWLSPAFPVGAFSYSHGLERAVHDGLVHDRESLHDWIEALITVGSGWNDAVLAAESHRLAQKGGALGDIVELAEALAGSHERHMETMLQGAAFLQAARQWPHPVLAALPDRCPYCVAFGAAAGAHGVALEAAISAWLQAFTTNLGQAAIRLSLIGQRDAVGLVAAMEPVILDVTARAVRSDLDDLGSATMMAEITAMRHETQAVRLFRT